MDNDDSEAQARVAAGTAGEILPPDVAADVDPGAVVGEFIAVSRAEWAEVRRERAELEHAVDGLAAAADRLREKYVAEHEAHTSTMFERDQLREAVERVRALHSPKPGWEREWTDPAEALAAGWPPCVGCWIEGVGYREIGKCPTLAALGDTDERSDRG